VARRAHEFDILHFNIELMHAPVVRTFAHRTLTTLHGRLDMPDLYPFYEAFPYLPLVSISDAQRAPMPPVNWAGTVHHGLPLDLLPFNPEGRRGYLAFLGRISPEKRPDRAIDIAVHSGLPLKIAAKIDRVDRPYWDAVIAPLVKAHKNVEFIGEISENEKPEFLGNASALLFPIDWPEPFGLVMVEAMSCGTPVIAYPHGSVREVIEPGVSGFVVDSIDKAVAAVDRALMLDRRRVRASFEQRFSVERMARDYVSIYKGQLAKLERDEELSHAASTRYGPPRSLAL
jgi:glycosyltransferase involved in cell wall biosynthesis